jgi:hypothetical protein
MEAKGRGATRDKLASVAREIKVLIEPQNQEVK